MSLHDISRLDYAANYRQRFEGQVDRLFLSQDMGWEVPYFVFKKRAEQDDAEDVVRMYLLKLRQVVLL